MAHATHVGAVMAIIAFAMLPSYVSAINLWKSQEATLTNDLQIKFPNSHDSNAKMTVSLPMRLEEAKHIIKTFDSLPSCPKVATAALMHSCSSPKEPKGDESHSASHTSDFLKAYGARLAVCELLEAGEAKSIIPKECQAFVPTQRSTERREMAGYVNKDAFTDPTILYPMYDELTKEDLDRCVRGLAQEPQSWSSYSNSKQNAVAICHSVQAELQLEQSVRMYEKMVNSFGGIVDHHSRMSEAYETQLAEVRATSKTAVSDFHNKWSQLYGAMDADIMGFTEALHERLLKLLSDASETTHSSLQNVKTTVSDLDKDVVAVAERTSRVANQVEFAGQYIEQHLFQQLGKIFLDLGVQHEILQTNILASDQITAGLIESLLQVNKTNERLSTTELSASAIRDTLHQANQDIELFSRNIGYLADFLNYNWPSLTGKILLFFASVITVTPLTFGFWERLVGFSFLGNCGAAFSTGLACGLASAYFFDPTKLFHDSPMTVFEDEHYAPKYVLVGIAVGIVGTLGVGLFFSALRSRLAAEKEKESISIVPIPGDNRVEKWRSGLFSTA